jgi:hypothetical protein
LLIRGKQEIGIRDSIDSGLRTGIVFDLSDIVCDWRTYGTPEKSDLADFRKSLGIPSYRGHDSPNVGQPYALGPPILEVPGYGGSETLAITGISPNARAVDDKDIGGNVFLNLTAAGGADDFVIRSTSNDYKVADAIAPFLGAQPSSAECDGCSEVRIRRNPAFSNFRLDDKPGNRITMSAENVLMSTEGQSTGLKDSPTMPAKATLAGNQESQIIPHQLDVLPAVSVMGTINHGMFMDILNMDLKGQLARFPSGQKQRGTAMIATGNSSTIPDVGACRLNGDAADSDLRKVTALTKAGVLHSAGAPILVPPMDDFQKRDVLCITGGAEECLQRVQHDKQTPSLCKNVVELPPTRRASRRTSRLNSAIGGLGVMPEHELGVMPEHELERLLRKRRERKAALREARLDDQAMEQSEGKAKCRQNAMKTPHCVYGVQRTGRYTRERSGLEQAAQEVYLARRDDVER